MVTKQWLELAAEIRPMVDRIEGLDGEFLDYLVDAVDSRNGADCDEYRALMSFARQARKVREERRGYPCWTNGKCAGGWPILNGACSFCGGFA